MLRYGHSLKKPGRPTLNDGVLMGRRDRLVWLLSVAWGDIGYDLPRARDPEQLHSALSALRGHRSEDIVAIFLQPTSGSGTSKEIRNLRKQLDEAVNRRQAAHEEETTRSRSFDQALAGVKMHQIENAETELKLDPSLDERHRNAIVSEFKKREAALHSAQRDIANASELETNLRAELRDKEAAFAQAELLDYIEKGQYARNPLGLANAMAGLPDLGWSQSYSRCSKLNCSGWPNLWFSEFEIIQDIWKKREPFREPSIVELFRREVQKLPRKTLVYYEPEAKKIWMPNQVRSRLADNFRLLRLAIEETLQLRMHPGRIQFAITSSFEKNIEKPRTASDDLLIAHERIE